MSESEEDFDDKAKVEEVEDEQPTNHTLDSKDGSALLAWSHTEGKIFEHAMSGFDLGKSEEPKVEVRDTENLTQEQEAQNQGWGG